MANNHSHTHIILFATKRKEEKKKYRKNSSKKKNIMGIVENKLVSWPFHRYCYFNTHTYTHNIQTNNNYQAKWNNNNKMTIYEWIWRRKKNPTDIKFIFQIYILCISIFWMNKNKHKKNFLCRNSSCHHYHV